MLEADRNRGKEALAQYVHDTNAELELPTLRTLNEYTDQLFVDGRFKEFLINWFLLEFNVRNLDLVFDIVKLKRLAQDADKNFVWLTRDKAIYYRRVYKTAKNHGFKNHVIKDDRVRLSLKMVSRDWNFTEDDIGYWTRKATYNGLGEGKYCKVCVNANRNNLAKLREMSINRGSSVEMLCTSYNVAYNKETNELE